MERRTGGPIRFRARGKIVKTVASQGKTKMRRDSRLSR